MQARRAKAQEESERLNKPRSARPMTLLLDVEAAATGRGAAVQLAPVTSVLSAAPKGKKHTVLACR